MVHVYVGAQPLLAGLGGFGAFGDGPLIEGAVPTDPQRLAALLGAAGNDPRMAAEALRIGLGENGGNWESYAKGAVEAGCAAALGAIGCGSLCGLVSQLWDSLVGAIKEWITIKIDPMSDFLNWCADQIGVARGPDVARQLRQGGYDYVNCGKRKSNYDGILAQRASLGWNPRGTWTKTYGADYQWGSGKGTYYGLLYHLDDMPAALRTKVVTKKCLEIRWMKVDQATFVSEATSRQGDVDPAIPPYPGYLDAYSVCPGYGIEIPAAPAPDSASCTGPLPASSLGPIPRPAACAGKLTFVPHNEEISKKAEELSKQLLHSDTQNLPIGGGGMSVGAKVAITGGILAAILAAVKFVPLAFAGVDFGGAKRGKAAGCSPPKGARVQLHPATDRWMMGDRYGEVVSCRPGAVRVRLDRSGRTVRFHPRNVEEI